MKNHQWSMLGMFGDLVLGMREIVEVHHLQDEAAWDIAGLLGDLFEAYVWRRCRNEQRSRHAIARALVLGMCEIIDTHDLGDEVVGHLGKVVEDLLAPHWALCRTREASLQELFNELLAIYRGDRDEEPLTPRELLDDLLAMSLERHRKKQKPRRQGPHPAMVELLARLDRYGSDNEKAQSKQVPAAD